MAEQSRQRRSINGKLERIRGFDCYCLTAVLAVSALTAVDLIYKTLQNVTFVTHPIMENFISLISIIEF